MLTRTIDTLFVPLRTLTPVAGLLLVSFGLTLVMLLLVKLTSRAAKLERAKRQMYAALLEMRLFDDDLRAVFRAALEVVRRNLSYLLALAPSVVVAAIPLTLLLAHLDSFYSTIGLAPGESTLLTLRLRNEGLGGKGGLDPGAVRLDAPASVRIDTPPALFPQSDEIVWRLVPRETGRFRLLVHVGDEAIPKVLDVSGDVVRRAPSRSGGAWLDDVVSPADATLPDTGLVREVAVHYPNRELRVLGWEVNWLVLLAVSSVVFAFALRGPLGVSI